MVIRPDQLAAVVERRFLGENDENENDGRDVFVYFFSSK